MSPVVVSPAPNDSVEAVSPPDVGFAGGIVGIDQILDRFRA